MSVVVDVLTDSDDEEILFTKEMVRRLRNAEKKIPPNSRPTSSLSDTSGVSTMSIVSTQKKAESSSDSSTLEEIPTHSTSTKELRSSESSLLTPR
ncbi:unnamed protein product [Cylicocyclus nassatus]|uniref:Uncharacterized protein n=1 Tax=Cylicocyclus nassatus TaxID=53992 RepID=A0AA36MEA3_CYLNA|nr:unnamed protein product [Cylicocyclus nassatus]